jgi:hypothetical protein
MNNRRMLRRRSFLLAVVLLALPAVAGAASQLQATGVRIGDHPAFVRVVVDFNGNVPASQVWFDRLGRTTAALHVAHPGIKTHSMGRTGAGVHVALEPGTQALHLEASFVKRRFKYVSYAVVTGNRLAIDLWKSTPYGINKPIRTCKGLTLSGWSANGSTVVTGGHEHGIFENQFQVIVRGDKGAVLGRKSVRGPGRWRTRVHYHVAFSQPGMVEAVALSPKDGSLACIAELGINLPAT